MQIPPQPPIQLIAFALQRDDDPLAPSDQQAVFDLHQISPAPSYKGKSNNTAERLELTFTRQADTLHWDAQLDVYDAYRNPETFYYADLPLDPTQPITTPLFGDVVRDGHDFRQILITE